MRILFCFNAAEFLESRRKKIVEMVESQPKIALFSSPLVLNCRTLSVRSRIYEEEKFVVSVVLLLVPRNITNFSFNQKADEDPKRNAESHPAKLPAAISLPQ